MDAQRLLFCALCFFIGVQSHCQLKIGGDPYRIHPYALLELESSERALLLPRLSTIELDRSFTAPIPVAVETDFESRLALGVKKSCLFEESMLQQQLYFETPTKSDRWGWGVQSYFKQASFEKYQKLGAVLSYRIPLNTRTNLYLGSQLNAKSLFW
jgi:hypothetical protein